MFHLKEPLHREFRLNRHIGAFGVTHLIIIVLDLLQQSGFLHVDDDLLAHILTRHADINASGLADGGVVVEDVDALQVVLLAQHIVIHIVGGSDLQTARTELDVDIVILDDGDDTVDQRHYDFLAAQPLVLWVGRVDAHGRVAHDGLGTRGGYHGIAATLLIGVDDFAFIARGTSAVVLVEIVA